MSDTLEVKSEKALIDYLTPIGAEFGATAYEGHGHEDMEAFPRYIVTASRSSGDQGGGVYEIGLSIQGVTETHDTARLSEMKDAFIEALCLDSIPEIKAAVNRPASGPDNRAVTGFALSGIEYNGSEEGRDGEKNLHGFILLYSIWAAIVAD